jgi:hypothetical protein
MHFCAQKISPFDRPKALETGWFGGVIGTCHGSRINQDQLHRFDCPGSDKNSSDSGTIFSLVWETHKP